MRHVKTSREKGPNPILVIDLDGTLLAGDLLYESLLAYLLPAPWRGIKVMSWLLQGGRPLLKARLGENVVLDGALLPWNRKVVDFCEAHFREGGKIMVATASNEKAARNVTAHFPFVSEVKGSGETLNLKGKHKADFLVSTFGPSGFDYIGDGPADRPVWEAAGKAGFVGTEARRLGLEKKLGKPLVSLCRGKKAGPACIIKALRPHQWLKNLLVFVPLLAAHRWSDSQCWQQTVPVFLALCCMASASYLLNDLSDLEADRRHVRKKDRPFASGVLGIPTGLVLIPVLFSAGIALASASGGSALAATLCYFLLSGLYSMRVKAVPVFDTLFLSGLYTYRIVLGGIASSVMVSPWLLAFSTTFFLGLAFLKRYVELDAFSLQESGPVPGRGYVRNDLVFVLVSGVSSSFLSVVVLALYLDSSASNALYRHPQWLWVIGFALLLWIIRVWFLAGRKQMNDDPVWFAAKDPVTLALAVLCLGVIAAAGPI